MHLHLCLSFFFLFLCAARGIAQDVEGNLVPNSSFEEFNPKFTGPADVNNSFRLLAHWRSPNYGSPDAFHPRYDELVNKMNMSGQNDQSTFDPIPSRTGEGHIGLVPISFYSYREYLQVKLAAPLKKDSTYYVHAYVAMGEKLSSHTTSAFGFAITPRPLRRGDNRCIVLKPQIENSSSNFIRWTDWQKIGGTYVAKGGERFLTIGNFKPHSATPMEKTDQFLPVNESRPSGYIFVDDVYLGQERPNEIDFEQFMAKGSVNLNNILFKTASAELMVASIPIIEELAVFLESSNEVRINIIGHTDNMGESTDNIELSKARAASVKSALVKKGIAASRLQTDGKGDTVPIEDNATETGRKLNRRVEIQLIK